MAWGMGAGDHRAMYQYARYAFLPFWEVNRKLPWQYIKYICENFNTPENDRTWGISLQISNIVMISFRSASGVGVLLCNQFYKQIFQANQCDALIWYLHCILSTIFTKYISSYLILRRIMNLKTYSGIMLSTNGVPHVNDNILQIWRRGFCPKTNFQRILN